MTVTSANGSIEAGFQPARAHLARIGLDNALERATLTATSSVAGRPVTNLLGRDTYQTWRPTEAEAAIEATFAPAELIDYLAMVRHDMGSGGITAAIEIKPESGAWTKAADLHPQHDGLILIPLALTSAEGVRVIFGVEGLPTLAVLMAGKAVVMERPLRASMQPVFLSRRTRVLPQISETGQFLGSIVTAAGVEVSPEWSHLSRRFDEGMLRPPAALLPGRAVCFSWRPDEAPDEAVYGVVTDDPAGSHIPRVARYTFGFSLRGMAAPASAMTIDWPPVESGHLLTESGGGLRREDGGSIMLEAI